MDKFTIIDRIKHHAKIHGFEILAANIVGSTAVGLNTIDSDIDVIVAVNTKISDYVFNSVDVKNLTVKDPEFFLDIQFKHITSIAKSLINGSMIDLAFLFSDQDNKLIDNGFDFYSLLGNGKLFPVNNFLNHGKTKLQFYNDLVNRKHNYEALLRVLSGSDKLVPLRSSENKEVIKTLFASNNFAYFEGDTLVVEGSQYSSMVFSQDVKHHLKCKLNGIEQMITSKHHKDKALYSTMKGLMIALSVIYEDFNVDTEYLYRVKTGNHDITTTLSKLDNLTDIITEHHKSQDKAAVYDLKRKIEQLTLRNMTAGFLGSLHNWQYHPPEVTL